MESQHATKPQEVEPIWPHPLNAAPDVSGEMGRLVQEAFQDAYRTQVNTSMKRGLAYARVQRAQRNNGGGN